MLPFQQFYFSYFALGMISSAFSYCPCLDITKMGAYGLSTQCCSMLYKQAVGYTQCALLQYCVKQDYQCGNQVPFSSCHQGLHRAVRATYSLHPYRMHCGTLQTSPQCKRYPQKFEKVSSPVNLFLLKSPCLSSSFFKLCCNIHFQFYQ